MDKEQKAFYERLESKGVSRRSFMKYCTFPTASSTALTEDRACVYVQTPQERCTK